MRKGVGKVAVDIESGSKERHCELSRLLLTHVVSFRFRRINEYTRTGRASVQPPSSLADSFYGIQEAEAQVVAIAWIVPIPTGRPHIASVVDPTAATYYTVRALRSSP